ncbi:MAG: DNA polymerase III subunit beta [Bacteroidaceae bacterium]|nr:DNA polymerase III subunit beta [Bacteroidaceae bacterium]
MKIKVSSAALFSRLTSINRVLNSKNSFPILDCYLFETQGQQMSITASDSETTLVTTVELIECDSDARFCIKAKTIQDSLKEISEQPIVLDVNLDTLEITGEYQNGKFNIIGERADEYPAPHAMDGDTKSYTLSQGHVLSGINNTLFATADDEIRPVMTGVYFDFTPDCLVFVGTDGRKLVRKKDFTVKSEQQVGFILPKKPANILKSLLQKGDANLELTFNDKMACLQAPEFKLTCRLIDGRYPNYNSVIPQNNPYTATIDRAALVSTLKRVLVFSSQSSAQVKLAFKKEQLIVSGRDIDYSTSAEERLMCEYDAPAMSIGFKGTLLLDILNNLEGAEVSFQLADPGRAGIILPAQQKEEEEVLMLLMPMMLND